MSVLWINCGIRTDGTIVVRDFNDEAGILFDFKWRKSGETKF